jgi:hypothetical protein
MDMGSDYTSPASIDPWERMKPKIQHLYLVERKKLSDIVLEMKARHNFDAV